MPFVKSAQKYEILSVFYSFRCKEAGAEVSFNYYAFTPSVDCVDISP